MYSKPYIKSKHTLIAIKNNWLIVLVNKFVIFAQSLH